MRASRVSAVYGARVAIAEPGHFGGTCVNVGCIPKKLFSYAAHWREEFEVAAAYGWTAGEPRFDWPTLLANKDREIARLNGVYERALTSVGVKIHRARARVIDPHTVDLDGRAFKAKHILIATGAWPLIPPIPGHEHAISSNEAFHLERLPRRAVVVGGGYIALEFASIFHGLGVQTTLSYRGRRLLRGFDAELGSRIAEEMVAKGIAICFGCEPAAMRKRADGSLQIEFTDGRLQDAELVMFATGRRPNTRNLGLAEAGIRFDAKGAITVDEWSRSSVRSVYAIGDVTDRLNLTPVAIAEGRALAETLFNNNPMNVDHETVPTAVFSQPPIGTVGLTERRARERYAAIDVYRTRFKPMKNILAGRDERTMMKLVVDRASDRVLGCHMVGADAPEITQGLAIALRCGATKAQFDRTIGIHPSAAEEFVTLREKVPEPIAKAAE